MGAFGLSLACLAGSLRGLNAAHGAHRSSANADNLRRQSLRVAALTLVVVCAKRATRSWPRRYAWDSRLLKKFFLLRFAVFFRPLACGSARAPPSSATTKSCLRAFAQRAKTRFAQALVSLLAFRRLAHGCGVPPPYFVGSGFPPMGVVEFGGSPPSPVEGWDLPRGVVGYHKCPPNGLTPYLRWGVLLGGGAPALPSLG